MYTEAQKNPSHKCQHTGGEESGSILPDTFRLWSLQLASVCLCVYVCLFNLWLRHELFIQREYSYIVDIMWYFFESQFFRFSNIFFSRVATSRNEKPFADNVFGRISDVKKLVLKSDRNARRGKHKKVNRKKKSFLCTWQGLTYIERTWGDSTYLVTPMRNDRYPLLRNRNVLNVCEMLVVGFLNSRQQHKRIADGRKNGMR